MYVCSFFFLLLVKFLKTEIIYAQKKQHIGIKMYEI